MITPENREALATLDKRIKKNLEAGDWGPSSKLTSTIFVPMDEEGNVLTVDEVADD